MQKPYPNKGTGVVNENEPLGHAHLSLGSFTYFWASHASMPWIWRPLRAHVSRIAGRRAVHNTAARLGTTPLAEPIPLKAELNAAVVLRPYQESALDACTDALTEGAERLGVSLPTGSGKTTVFLELLARIAPPVDRPTATRALVVVNAIELARQAAAQAQRMFPHWSVEIEQGANKASGLADMCVFNELPTIVVLA
jgi:superfamily II DNA or RNA helicase